MLGNIGPMEIGILLIVVLLVFGAKRLPELGSGLGRGIRDFKSGLEGRKDEELDAGEIADADDAGGGPAKVETGD
jgi:sec-independent protein translocase protein TatA